MAKALHRKRELNRSSLFHFIIIELFEMGIRVLGQIEDYIDQLETQIIRSSLNNQLLTSLLVLKSRLYDMGKFIRADLEPIREIMEGEVPEIDIEEFSDQPEDRALYLIDLIDAQREELSNLINLHLAIASNNMNRRFYWLTILGSLLIVPSIVSGIFGMNVVLPDIGFWELLILMLVLTVFTAMIVKWLIPNNQLA